MLKLSKEDGMNLHYHFQNALSDNAVFKLLQERIKFRARFLIVAAKPNVLLRLTIFCELE